MNDLFRQWFSALLAGFSIGLATDVFLNVGGIAGACLFAVGLLIVVSLGFDLFTGKAQFVWGRKGLLWLVTMLAFNVLGTGLASALIGDCVLVDVAEKTIQSRLAMDWWRVGLMAVPCGFIMTAAVRAAKNGNWWVILLGVPTFILCGFPHCIADSFYAACANADWNVYGLQCWLPTVLGNYLGCNLYRLSNNYQIKSITIK